ncbi:MAG: hypothetical protein AB1486_26860, partial [Planctomycetota bacterium]
MPNNLGARVFSLGSGGLRFLLPLLKKNPTLFEFYRPLIESLGREEDGAGMARALATWLEPATRNVLPPESFEALIAT